LIQISPPKDMIRLHLPRYPRIVLSNLTRYSPRSLVLLSFFSLGPMSRPVVAHLFPGPEQSLFSSGIAPS
jgi:hypothetical protein